MKNVLRLFLVAALAATLCLAGCEGDDGSNGQSAYQLAVQNGFTGTEAEWLASLEAQSASAVQPESCATCHNGDGDYHQAEYDQLYQDGVIQVANFAYSYDAANANHVLTFAMTKSGQAFDCTQADLIGGYFAEYTGGEFSTATTSLISSSSLSYDAATGICTSTVTGTEDLAAKVGIITLYGTDEVVRVPGPHMELGKYPFAALIKLNGVDYVSAANVSGCEKCHTQPYLKHAYIYGQVAGSDDFYTCKGCHYDTRGGHVWGWQILANDPYGYATLPTDANGAPVIPAALQTEYAYNASLMNDVHMSHAMEFGYPQSMSNCATCHEGKLNTTTTDANFTAETCKSCHPLTAPVDANGVAAPQYAEAGRAPALETIWAEKGVTFHTIDMTCNVSNCHDGGTGAKSFSDIHTGYNPVIYGTNDGTTYAKYSSSIAVTIDTASFVAATNTLSINFSAAGTLGGLDAKNIVPHVQVALYGYDTKDFIASNHGRDADGNRVGEFTLDGTSTSPYFSNVVINGDGTWSVDFTLPADWAAMLADGTVKRAEIAVLPALDNAAGDMVALNAASKTFNFVNNAFQDNYYENDNAIVKVADGCNTCHDALAENFHSPNYGGNIVVCRMCHVVGNGGSHLEMQSRSIDSYVHAIHSMQPFDYDSIDFTDPVEAMRYHEKIESTYPTFDITNCESCHNAGTYNVPDQTKSLAGLLSSSDTNATRVRNIGDIPSYIVGPASRACGSCHRAQMINEDAAGEVVSFNQHTATFGTLLDAASNTLNDVIAQLQTLF